MNRYLFFFLTVFCYIHAEIQPLEIYKDSLDQVIASSSNAHERFRAKKKILDLHWYESKPSSEVRSYYEDLILELELNEEWDLAMESVLSIYYSISTNASSDEMFLKEYALAKEKFLPRTQNDLIRLKSLVIDFDLFLEEDSDANQEFAKQTLDEMNVLTKRIGTDEARANYLFTKANIHQYFGEKDQELEVYLELLPILESNKFYYDPWLEKALVYNNALNLMHRGDQGFVYNMVEKSIAYNQIIGQDLGIVANYTTLASTYSSNGMFKKSNEYFDKSIREAKRINSDRFQIEGIFYKALNYMKMKQYTTAEKLLRQTLFRLNGTEGASFTPLDVKMKLAMALVRQNKLNQLDLLYDDLNRSVKKDKNSNIQLRIDLLYFKMLYNALKSNYNLAKTNFNQLMPLVKSLGDHQLASAIYLDWSKYCEETARLKEAYSNMKLFSDYRDSASMDLVEKKLYYKDLENKYVKALNSKARNKNNGKRNRLKSNKWGSAIMAWVVVLFLVVVLASLAVYKNRKIKYISNDLVAVSNKLNLTENNLEKAIAFSENQFHKNAERLRPDPKIEEGLPVHGIANNRLLVISTLYGMDLARENMKLFSAITKGNMVVKPDHLSLNTIVNKIGPEVLEINPEFKIHHRIPNHSEIFVDKGHIALVIRNLVSIAVYRSGGEGRLDLVATENKESHILEINVHQDWLPTELISWLTNPKASNIDNVPFKLEFSVIRYVLDKNRAKLLVDVGDFGYDVVRIYLPKKPKDTA